MEMQYLKWCCSVTGWDIQSLIWSWSYSWMCCYLCCCRRFTDNTGAQMWYFTKCVYFALSAYQIRCGYPTRILGNFLTKKYNYLNLICFKGYTYFCCFVSKLSACDLNLYGPQIYKSCVHVIILLLCVL